MSQSYDYEERKSMQKRQKKQKDTVMKGNIDPQQAVKLLRRQWQ